MSAKKKTIKLEPLLDAAIRHKGRALPTTDEELEALERELERQEMPLPARLVSAPDFGGSRTTFRLKSRGGDAAVEEMGRAARSGGSIPKDVEARMQRDRAAAASGQGDDEEE